MSTTEPLPSESFNTYRALVDIMGRAALSPVSTETESFSPLADMLHTWMGKLDEELREVYSDLERTDSKLGQVTAELALVRASDGMPNHRKLAEAVMQAMTEMLPPYHQGEAYRRFAAALSSIANIEAPAGGEQ